MNTSATADISFMLLVFFLVTTSMDNDKGIGRQMPPIEQDNEEVVRDVDKDFIITLHLLENGTITLNDAPASISDAMRKELRHLIVEKGNRHIIELIVDRNADYDSYFRLQNHIVRAYGELRNAAAMKKYGRPYTKCTEEQQDFIAKAYPKRIQEVAQAVTTKQD